MKKGICVAGDMLVDITYPIERWPAQSELTHITEGDLETPRVVRLEGTPPPQFAEEAFDFEAEEDFMDDDLYADDLGEDFPDDFSDDFPDMGEAPEDYY